MKRISKNTCMLWVRFLPPVILALIGFGGLLQYGRTYGVKVLFGLAIGWFFFGTIDYFFERWLKSRSKLQNADFDGVGRSK